MDLRFSAETVGLVYEMMTSKFDLKVPAGYKNTLRLARRSTQVPPADTPSLPLSSHTKPVLGISREQFV